MSALALFVGHRGSVTVYSEFRSSANRRAFEEHLENVESKKKSLQHEANIIYVTFGQENFPDLDREYQFVVTLKQFVESSKQLRTFLAQKRNQQKSLTIDDANTFMEQLQTTEAGPSSRLRSNNLNPVPAKSLNIISSWVKEMAKTTEYKWINREYANELSLEMKYALILAHSMFHGHDSSSDE